MRDAESKEGVPIIVLSVEKFKGIVFGFKTEGGGYSPYCIVEVAEDLLVWKYDTILSTSIEVGMQ